MSFYSSSSSLGSFSFNSGPSSFLGSTSATITFSATYFSPVHGAGSAGGLAGSAQGAMRYLAPANGGALGYSIAANGTGLSRGIEIFVKSSNGPGNVPYSKLPGIEVVPTAAAGGATAEAALMGGGTLAFQAGFGAFVLRNLDILAPYTVGGWTRTPWKLMRTIQQARELGNFVIETPDDMDAWNDSQAWRNSGRPDVAGAILREREYVRSGKALPNQIHHFATNKNSLFTPQMEEIAGRFGLNLDDAWNKQLLPHLGRHPNAYHNFVLQGMIQAAAEANGDPAAFLRLFDIYVRQPIMNNTDLLRRAGWE